MPPATLLNRKEIGRRGEADAVTFLQSLGYRIAGTNVRPLPGLARGEIDIVARDGSALCFVEVKSRRSDRVPPDLGITAAKRKQLIMLAEAYLSTNPADIESVRFDVVSVWNDPALPTPMLLLHRDAFGAE